MCEEAAEVVKEVDRLKSAQAANSEAYTDVECEYLIEVGDLIKVCTLRSAYEFEGTWESTEDKATALCERGVELFESRVGDWTLKVVEKSEPALVLVRFADSSIGFF